MSYLLSFSLLTAVPAKSCFNHLAYDGDIVDGPVEILDNPLLNFDGAMIPVYNSSVIESWSADAVSADGESGLALTSSRGSVRGVEGAQRMFLSAVWPNGTQFIESSFTEESNVEVCPKKTVASWYNNTDVNWTFEFSADYKHTPATIDTPTVQGTITIEALSPALYPNGLEYPDSNGAQLFAPGIFWVESVPTGIVEANLTILGSPFILHGHGGRERNWLSVPWFSTSRSWDMLRGGVGPYSYVGWLHHSKIDGSQFSMVLLKDKQIVFRTDRTQPSSTEPWATITQTNIGPVHLADSTGQIPESTYTGYTLDMVSPKTGRHWRFDVEFSATVYWFPVGATARIAGFGATVKCGQVGGHQSNGWSSGNLQETI
ncbi:hypothetical protein Q7P36_007052 [Cladosporium allicinum]